MKKIILLILTTLLLSSLYAQKISSKDVLATALSDEELQYNQQLATFAQGLKFYIPIVKQIEARIGFNGSALGDTLYGYIRNEDTYGIQIGFNSFKEIKQQKVLKINQIGVYQSENRVLEQQALMARYQILVAVRFTQEALITRQKLDTLLSKKHEILRGMMERGLDIKVKDVMDTEGDQNAVQLNLFGLENDKRFHQSQLQQFLENKMLSELDFDNFITIEKISEIVDNQKLILSQFPSIDFKIARTQLATAELDYVNSQNRQIFNNARIGYDNPLYLEEQKPKKFNTLNNFSLRFGFTVPLLGNSNFKRSEALLKQRIAQNEVDLLRQQNKQNVDIQYLKLENLLKRYRYFKEKIENNLIKKMLANEKLLAQMTPLELVDMQLTQQKLEVRYLDIGQEMTSEYIKLLELTGALSAKPLKNYLSESLEEF